MNTLNARATTILHDCADLLRSKGEDYSGGSIDELDYFKFQHDTPHFDVLWSKILRYKSILDQGDEMNFDNARDTLMDIVNYAARAHAYMDLYWIEDDGVSPPTP